MDTGLSGKKRPVYSATKTIASGNLLKPVFGNAGLLMGQCIINP